MEEIQAVAEGWGETSKVKMEQFSFFLYLCLFFNHHLRVCLLILEIEEGPGGERKRRREERGRETRCERETLIGPLLYAP